eukprot:4723210-Amphidinium_carterae.1
MLRCSVCGLTDTRSNRKRFMKKHLCCLQEALVWDSAGDYTVDLTVLARGSKRVRRLDTFDEGQRPRKRGRLAAT